MVSLLAFEKDSARVEASSHYLLIVIILFSRLLGRIDDSTSFIASALILRIIEAVGSSAALVAAMSIIGGHHTHYAPQMLGLLDMFSGLAFMIGPMVGTLLYQVSSKGDSKPV